MYSIRVWYISTSNPNNKQHAHVTNYVRLLIYINGYVKESLKFRYNFVEKITIQTLFQIIWEGERKICARVWFIYSENNLYIYVTDHSICTRVRGNKQRSTVSLYQRITHVTLHKLRMILTSCIETASLTRDSLSQNEQQQATSEMND